MSHDSLIKEELKLERSKVNIDIESNSKNHDLSLKFITSKFLNETSQNYESPEFEF